MDTIIMNSENSKTSKPDFLSLFRMGIFVAAHRWGGPKSPTSCHTYPTMTKLGSYSLPKGHPKSL